MDENNKDLLPATTPQETALDVTAAVASIVPWVGGPIGAVLTGMSQTRKINRVREVLVNMAHQIKDIDTDVSQNYVKTEDFEELLEKTLRQAAEERNEEKRRAYAAFLANDIKSPGRPYDEKIRILRTLEEIQADHIRVLKVLLQEPDPNIEKTSSIGAISQTLQRQLPDMSSEAITDLARQLTDMRLAELGSLNTMMTARGAEDLRSRVTEYGRRFVQYILISP
jgi:hypothetical protein